MLNMSGPNSSAKQTLQHRQEAEDTTEAEAAEGVIVLGTKPPHDGPEVVSVVTTIQAEATKRNHASHGTGPPKKKHRSPPKNDDTQSKKKATKLTEEEKKARLARRQANARKQANDATMLPHPTMKSMTFKEIDRVVCIYKAIPAYGATHAEDIQKAPFARGLVVDEETFIAESTELLDIDNFEGELDYKPVEGDGKVVIDLDKMKVVQWRLFCKILNIEGNARKTGEQIRFAIGHAKTQGAIIVQSESKRVQVELKRTTTLLRLVNVLSLSSMAPKFWSLNNKLGRKEHESNNTPKDFYQEVSDIHSQLEDEDDDGAVIIIQFLESDDELELKCRDLDLSQYNFLNSSDVKKAIKKLITSFKVMKGDMRLSGSNSDDPWDYVKNTVRKTTGLGEIEIVYFYRFCELHADVAEATVGDIASPVCGGSTDNLGGSIGTSSQRKKNPELAFVKEALKANLEVVQANSEAMQAIAQKRIKVIEENMAADREQKERENLFKAMESWTNATDPFMKMIAKNQIKQIAERFGFLTKKQLEELEAEED